MGLFVAYGVLSAIWVMGTATTAPTVTFKGKKNKEREEFGYHYYYMHAAFSFSNILLIYHFFNT